MPGRCAIDPAPTEPPRSLSPHSAGWRQPHRDPPPGGHDHRADSTGMNVHPRHRPSTREEAPMSLSNFKVLTFDVVGTLIDFETGVLNAVRKISSRSVAELSDERIFASYKRGRDAHPERSSEVMFDVYRFLAKELGLPADDLACDAFQLAVLRWQPFVDSVEALPRLRTKFPPVE